MRSKGALPGQGEGGDGEEDEGEEDGRHQGRKMSYQQVYPELSNEFTGTY